MNNATTPRKDYSPVKKFLIESGERRLSAPIMTANSYRYAARKRETKGPLGIWHESLRHESLISF